jgi:hypothetical protein
MYAMTLGRGDIVVRMRGTLAVVILALATSRAAADDRAPVLDVEGAAGMVMPSTSAVDGTTVDPAPLAIGRVMIAWEQPAVAMPAQAGSADWSADLAPELAVGFIGNDRRGDGFAQVGLRLNVGFAQNAMGLFHISARGGMWLAARAGVVGGDHDTMLEGDLGWYLWLGQAWRIGWEIGGLGVRNPTDANGNVMPLYVASPQDVSAVMHMAVFVGKRL